MTWHNNSMSVKPEFSFQIAFLVLNFKFYKDKLVASNGAAANQ